MRGRPNNRRTEAEAYEARTNNYLYCPTNMKRSIVIQGLTLLMVFVLLPAHAAVVHKWVDDKGVTHYSDQLPEAAKVEVTRIDVRERDSKKNRLEDNYYSIKNQWQRVRQERLQRDKLKLEQARQKAAAQASKPQIVYVNEADDKRYAPVYFGSFYKRHRHGRNHRKNRHKVGYPGKRPHRKFPPGLHPGRFSQRSY